MAKKQVNPEDCERIKLKQYAAAFADTAAEQPGYLRQEIQRAAGETELDPSEARKLTGNYRKGRFRLHGMEIAIENPKGSVRRGKDQAAKNGPSKCRTTTATSRRPKAKPTATTSIVSSGRIRQPPGRGDRRAEPHGRFDQHKVMLGWKSPQAAKKAYLSAYSRGWQGFAGMVTMTVSQFRNWLQHGDTGKRIVGQLSKY